MNRTGRYVACGILFVLTVVGAVACAAVSYFLSVQITPALAINILIVMAVFGVITYTASAWLATKVAQVKSPRRWAAWMTGAVALLLLAGAAYPTVSVALTPAPPSGEPVLAALRTHALPLDTVEPEGDFADLQPLKPILEGRRVAALGEATHGTHEFFAMKHRLIAFLVQEMGFEHFAMELSPEDGEQLNRYIMGEDVDPTQILYWPWSAPEVLAMLDWMRAYNADPQSPHLVTFHGIDPRQGLRDKIMAENVTQLLNDLGPESKVVLWAHNGHISAEEGCMGQYLKQTFGDEAYLLGFEFDHGTFTSRMMTVHLYTARPASSDYYAHALARLDASLLFLDFKTLSQDPTLRAWLAQPQRSHSICEAHAIYRLHPAWYTKTIPWPELYDGVIFVEESTPAVDVRAIVR